MSLFSLICFGLGYIGLIVQVFFIDSNKISSLEKKVSSLEEEISKLKK
jgi:uncharacterized membrane protein (DUF106 family)